MENKKFVFISISQGNWTGYNESVQTSTGSSKSNVSGYGEPDFSRVEEGALVLDNRPCRSRRDFIKSVYSSPLVDVDLKGDEVEECPAPSDMLMAGVDISFGRLLMDHKTLKEKKKYGSLDSISPQAYCGWWEERGARVGVVKGGQALWRQKS